MLSQVAAGTMVGMARQGVDSIFEYPTLGATVVHPHLPDSCSNVPNPFQSEDYDVVARLLREFRIKSGATQAELAERIELSKNTYQAHISKCENGERRLDILELRQWCQAVGVDLVEFVRALERELRRR